MLNKIILLSIMMLLQQNKTFAAAHGLIELYPAVHVEHAQEPEFRIDLEEAVHRVEAFAFEAAFIAYEKDGTLNNLKINIMGGDISIKDIAICTKDAISIIHAGDREERKKDALDAVLKHLLNSIEDLSTERLVLKTIAALKRQGFI